MSPPTLSFGSDSKLETSASLHLGLSEAIGPLQAEVRGSLAGEIRVLLRALPMRWDVEALILWVEEAHHQDIQVVRTDIKAY